MIIQRFHNFLKSLLIKERSPEKLALSLAVGIYIGFSPFVGCHTLLAIILAWLLRINFAVIWIGSHVINNPWTMVPIYGADYCVGEWVLSGWCGLDMNAYNPTWMHVVNNWLCHYTGLQVSLWSFLIGGNMVALVLSIMLYPLLKRIILKLVTQQATILTS